MVRYILSWVVFAIATMTLGSVKWILMSALPFFLCVRRGGGSIRMLNDRYHTVTTPVQEMPRTNLKFIQIRLLLANVFSTDFCSFFPGELRSPACLRTGSETGNPIRWVVSPIDKRRGGHPERSNSGSLSGFVTNSLRLFGREAGNGRNLLVFFPTVWHALKTNIRTAVSLKSIRHPRHSTGPREEHRVGAKKTKPEASTGWMTPAAIIRDFGLVLVYPISQLFRKYASYLRVRFSLCPCDPCGGWAQREVRTSKVQ